MAANMKPGKSHGLRQPIFRSRTSNVVGGVVMIILQPAVQQSVLL